MLHPSENHLGERQSECPSKVNSNSKTKVGISQSPRSLMSRKGEAYPRLSYSPIAVQLFDPVHDQLQPEPR